MNVNAYATLACALKSLIGYQSHQLTSVCKSVFSKHVTVQQQIVLGLMYSALPLRHQHICTAKMSNTESLQNLLYNENFIKPYCEEKYLVYILTKSF